MDETTEVEPQDVAIPWPDAEDLRLRVAAGACRLRVHASDTDQWVSGSYTDPTGTLPLQVTGEHGHLRISQSARLSEVRRFKAAAPTLDVGIGVDRPFRLAIETGASDAELELGGVQITRLNLRLGAGNATVGFDRRSQTAMQRMDVEAGAAAVVMSGLGHASPDRLVVVGGAATYVLRFDGDLQRDMSAKVTTAGAGVSIHVPHQTPARIGVVSVLAGLTVRDGFQTWEDSFWTPSGQDGARPLLSVDTSITLGSLEVVADGVPGQELEGPPGEPA